MVPPPFIIGVALLGLDPFDSDSELAAHNKR